MPTRRFDASALCLQSTPDAVLVIGGDRLLSEAPRCAELLIHTAGTSAGGEGAWQWRKLNEMHERRDGQPGMLLLLQAGGDKQRVLVAGGRSRTAEILQLSCSDPSDCGQWTQIAHLSGYFLSTFLVEWRNRIFAIGSFLACTKPSFSRD